MYVHTMSYVFHYSRRDVYHLHFQLKAERHNKRLVKNIILRMRICQFFGKSSSVQLLKAKSIDKFVTVIAIRDIDAGYSRYRIFIINLRNQIGLPLFTCNINTVKANCRSTIIKHQALLLLSKQSMKSYIHAYFILNMSYDTHYYY